MSQAAARHAKPERSTSQPRNVQFKKLYHADKAEIVLMVRRGVAARTAKSWLANKHISIGDTLRALDLSVATFNRKVAKKETFSPAESERIVGFARLIGQVQTMVENTDGSAEFDAAEWLSRWLREPLPALGGAKPIDYMDTVTGQDLISQKLDQIAHGVYA